MSDLTEKLIAAVALRSLGIPRHSAPNNAQACIAILFSGGLDCTLIARLLHDVLPLNCPIDLLNVAFENPRSIAAANKDSSSLAHRTPYLACPDRITGLSALSELQRICPGRYWQFVSIDVPYSETVDHRQRIVSLMYPHNTEMDFSIALALYFAARGTGTIWDSRTETSIHHHTYARVLLSGLGADELFAGYSRHSIAFKRGGQKALLEELILDFSRLSKRNLGRDDRIISHWGREIRFPYLDEDVVDWVVQRPVWEKCSYSTSNLEEGISDEPVLEPAKHLLRLAAWKLCMEKTATEKKRAIQFGARTARMEVGRVRGTRVLQA